MALADIVKRIDRDAVQEAQSVAEEAQKRADALVNEARERAEADRARTLARVERDAKGEAATLLASARLEARDGMLAAKRELVDRALQGARDRVLALEDGAYADLFARRIVAAARGGETVLVASGDASRLAQRLEDAVARAGGAGLGIVWGADPAPVQHGVVLKGDRVSVDLSVDAAIQERRDELLMLAADVLFGGAEE